MTVIDLLIGVFLIYKVFRGFMNGFIEELASLLSILIALFVAINYYGYVLSFMQLFIHSNATDMTIYARVITFVLTILVVIIGSNFLTKMIDLAQLGLINKILGSLFGLLKGILIMSIFLNVFAKINASKWILSKQQIDESSLYFPLIEVSHTIFPTFGDWYEQYIQKPIEEIKPQVLEDKKDSE